MINQCDRVLWEFYNNTTYYDSITDLRPILIYLYIIIYLQSTNFHILKYFVKIGLIKQKLFVYYNMYNASHHL